MATNVFGRPIIAEVRYDGEHCHRPGIAGPWFGSRGGGTLYKLEGTVIDGLGNPLARTITVAGRGGYPILARTESDPETGEFVVDYLKNPRELYVITCRDLTGENEPEIVDGVIPVPM